jgi:hypothetical protein
MQDDNAIAASGLADAGRYGTSRRSGLVFLLAAAAIGLAACAGTTDSPHIASLGKNSGSGGGGSTTTTAPKGDPTQLLDEWAVCMRAHGDPNQADPTIDTNEVIHITWDPAIPGGYNGTQKGGQGNLGPGQYCRNYLTEAQSALGGGQAQQGPSQAQIVKVARCMRANGIPDFPDPVNGNLSFNVGASGDLNPNNPAFQTASKLCSEKTGVTLPGAGGTPPRGTIELNGAGPPGNAGGGANG